MSIQGKENLTAVMNERDKGLICLNVKVTTMYMCWPNMGTDTAEGELHVASYI